MINGVVAVPVMRVMMLMTAQRKVMAIFIIGGWLRWLGWASTGAMAACIVGMMIGCSLESYIDASSALSRKCAQSRVMVLWSNFCRRMATLTGSGQS